MLTTPCNTSKAIIIYSRLPQYYLQDSNGPWQNQPLAPPLSLYSATNLAILIKAVYVVVIFPFYLRFSFFNRQSSRHRSQRLSHYASQPGLKLKTNETEEMRLNVTSQEKLTVNGKEIKHVEKFVYVGTIMRTENNTKRY